MRGDAELHEELALEALGLGVAKIAVSRTDPTAIEVTYYGGVQADGVERRDYRSKTEIRLPGVFRLEDAGLTVSVARSGRYGFAISVSDDDGRNRAEGLGLTDPADPAAIMVAWWTGDTPPYGVVKYSITDPETVTGYYISKMTPDEPGEDIAIGDTGRGFDGDFVLRSREVSGRTWGPHAWTLSSRGGVTDLTWEENGRIFCRGIGMTDPRDSSSIIATYIAV